MVLKYSGPELKRQKNATTVKVAIENSESVQNDRTTIGQIEEVDVAHSSRSLEVGGGQNPLPAASCLRDEECPSPAP